MISTSKLCRYGAMALVLSLPGTIPAGQKHQGYDRTMDDLRWARALLQRPNEAQAVNGTEDEISLTIANLNGAMAEIEKEIGVEGKKPRAVPRIDPRTPWADRLTKSLKLLELAQQDCRTEKDNAGDNGLRARVLNQLDDAHTRITVAIATKNFDYDARNLPTRND